MEIEGFRDIAEFRRGGFGVVYRAYQPEFDRMVAIKVVLAGAIDDAGRDRFRAEVAAMGRLSGHPHIVAVYGAGFTPDGKPYLVMPFLGSGSAGDRLEERGRLPWDEATGIAVKIAGALQTAHTAGVLHRDVKPDNILFTQYGEPQLGDFGIARLQGAAATATGRLTASITYAAPEVLAGARATPASDVYSLAATLFALLNGAPAFYADTDESLAPFLARVATQAPPDLMALGVPEPVVAAVHAGMGKEVAQRPQTAADFGELLQAAQRTLGHQGSAMVLPPPRRPQSTSRETIEGGLLLPPVPSAAPTPEITPQPTPEIAAAPDAQPVTDDFPSVAPAAVGEPGPPRAAGKRAERSAPKRRAVLLAGVFFLAAVGVAAFALPRMTGTAADDRCDAFSDPSGDDAAEGTRDAPFQTVTQLLDVLQPGQTGCLAAGTFDELVNITRSGTAADPIVLTSADPSAPPPTLQGQVVVPEGTSNVTIEGLRIVGTQVPTMRVFGERIVIRNNDITNTEGTCIYMGDPVNGIAKQVTIQSNVIHNCGHETEGNSRQGIGIGTAHNTHIAGNVIRDNPDRGIAMYPNAENTLIERNVFVENNENIHLGGDAETATGGTQIQRNVLVEPDGMNFQTNWEGPVGGNNVVSDNCLAPDGGESSEEGLILRENVIAEPEFVDTQTYQLVDGSECARMGPPRPPGPIPPAAANEATP